MQFSVPYTIIILVIITLTLVIMFLLISSNYLRTLKKEYLFHKEIESIDIKYQRNLLELQLQVQNETLNHVSKEIHDNIGQSLTLSKFNLLTKQNLSDQDEAIYFISKAINDLRSLTSSFNTESLGQVGLIRTIEIEIDRYTQLTGKKFFFEVPDIEMPIDEIRSITLYRIFQESITNILKHSNASIVEITLHLNDDLITMEISDNGSGMDVHSKHTGNGIRNIRSRLEKLGGNLDISSDLGCGTTLQIIIPKQ